MVDEEMINEIADEATKNAEGNEDITKIREIQDMSIEEEVKELEDDEYNDKEADEIINKKELEDFDQNKFFKTFVSNAGLYDINEEDAAELFKIMIEYRKDNSISIYSRLPSKVKTYINNLCLSSGGDIKYAPALAKSLIEELVSQTAQDETMSGFEKQFSEVMKMPSISDMYQDHVSKKMLEDLPSIADKVENDDPEKAKQIRMIVQSFEDAITYRRLRELYDNNARVRKLIRKDYNNWSKYAKDMNAINAKSEFKFPDILSLEPILINSVCNNDITEYDIHKFIILICRSTDNIVDKDNIGSMAYVYYLTKNISLLGYNNAMQANTAETFSSELTSNIKTCIYYIQGKEKQFYEQNINRANK